MYAEHDPLAALHFRNAGNASIAPPERGTLNLDNIRRAGFAFI